MTTKVFTVAADEVDQLETKLNQLLGRPDFKDYEVAASFPNSNFSVIYIILQKP